jgi:MOSC domain-containing protein
VRVQGVLVVEQVGRYPVKSLRGEQAETSWADEHGLLGDRVWAVQDSDGKPTSAQKERAIARVTHRHRIRPLPAT